MEVIADPFRHVVIDGFLTPEYIDLAFTHFPSEDSDAWKVSENPHTHAKAVLQGMKYEMLAPEW